MSWDGSDKNSGSGSFQGARGALTRTVPWFKPLGLFFLGAITKFDTENKSQGRPRYCCCCWNVHITDSERRSQKIGYIHPKTNEDVHYGRWRPFSALIEKIQSINLCYLQRPYLIVVLKKELFKKSYFCWVMIVALNYSFCETPCSREPMQKHPLVRLI